MAFLKQPTKLLGLITAAGMLWSLNTNAELIDDFSTQQLIPGVSPGNSVTDTVFNGGILGGYRTLIVRNISGPNILSEAEAYVIGDELFVNNDTDVNGEVDVIWDANGSGLGGVDLTIEATGIAMEVISIDQNVTVEFIIEDQSNNVSNSGAKTFMGPGLFFVEFLDFIGTADFTDVNKITMMLRGPLAWDGRIDIVESTIPVPEPGSFVIMGLGLIGLGAARFKKKA